MERVGRVGVAAQWLRTYRVWAILGAFLVAVALDAGDYATGLSAALLPAVAIVFLFLPGLETIARNFRQGYRDEA